MGRLWESSLGSLGSLGEEGVFDFYTVQIITVWWPAPKIRSVVPFSFDSLGPTGAMSLSEL